MSERAIEDRRLIFVVSSREYSDSVASGKVISQSPRSLTVVDIGTTVSVVISMGPEPPEQVSVPGVVGDSESSARTAVENAGLVFVVSSRTFSDSVASGSVVSQSPNAGNIIVVGSTVSVVVSQGSASTMITLGDTDHSDSWQTMNTLRANVFRVHSTTTLSRVGMRISTDDGSKTMFYYLLRSSTKDGMYSVVAFARVDFQIGSGTSLYVMADALNWSLAPSYYYAIGAAWNYDGITCYWSPKSLPVSGDWINEYGALLNSVSVLPPFSSVSGGFVSDLQFSMRLYLERSDKGLATSQSVEGAGAVDATPGTEEESFPGGNMAGISDYEEDISAVISVDPSDGDHGILTTVSIIFTRGGEYVDSIYQFDATPQSGNQFIHNSYVNFTKTSPDTWEGHSTTGENLTLSGNASVLRFYAVDASGEAICAGDYFLNGGQNLGLPSWQDDGIGELIASTINWATKYFGDYLGICTEGSEFE